MQQLGRSKLMRTILTSTLLVMLSMCASQPESTDLQLYEVQTYLLEGARSGSEAKPPLFPGEIAIQFLDSTLADVERLQEQLRQTFGYQDVNMRDMTYLLFSPDGTMQTHHVPLQNDKYLQLTILPGATEHLSVNISLLQKAGITVASAEQIARAMREDKRTMLSTRTDLKPGQAVMLGRAIDDSADKALFLVLKPQQQRLTSLAAMGRILDKVRNAAPGALAFTATDFVEQIASHFDVPLDSVQELVGIGEQHRGSSESYEFGELDAKPSVKKAGEVIYPKEAAKQKLEGKTICRVLIDTQGNVIDAEVLRSSDSALLDSAALDAVRRYQFNPGQKDGKPVRTRVVIPFVFKLD